MDIVGEKNVLFSYFTQGLLFLLLKTRVRKRNKSHNMGQFMVKGGYTYILCRWIWPEVVYFFFAF